MSRARPELYSDYKGIFNKIPGVGFISTKTATTKIIELHK